MRSTKPPNLELFSEKTSSTFSIYIFVFFGGRVFQQTVGIPMGTKCAPLLADLFLYSYEADFIQRLLKKNEKKLVRSFNFTFRNIDDVLSTSSGIAYKLRDIYSICRCWWNVATYKWKVHNGKIEIIDDVLSLNNSRFGDFVDHIYSIEPETKGTTDTDRSVSCLDLCLKIDSEGHLSLPSTRYLYLRWPFFLWNTVGPTLLICLSA
jgi:hypothetical protein